MPKRATPAAQRTKSDEVSGTTTLVARTSAAARASATTKSERTISESTNLTVVAGAAAAALRCAYLSGPTRRRSSANSLAITEVVSVERSSTMTRVQARNWARTDSRRVRRISRWDDNCDLRSRVAISHTLFPLKRSTTKLSKTPTCGFRRSKQQFFVRIPKRLSRDRIRQFTAQHPLKRGGAVLLDNSATTSLSSSPCTTGRLPSGRLGCAHLGETQIPLSHV